jgi:hypothetical protein
VLLLAMGVGVLIGRSVFRHGTAAGDHRRRTGRRVGDGRGRR